MTDASIETFQPDAANPSPPVVRRALGRDSVARLAADLAGLALATVGAVITARALGPAGKGIAASLGFLAMILIRTASLGLGDSAVVMVGRTGATMRTALAANLAITLIASVAALLILAPAVIFLIDPDSTNVWLAAAVTAVAVPVGAIQDVVSHGLTMQQRIVQASISVAAVAIGTLLGLILFVAVLSLDVLGAALGTTVGALIGLAVSIALLSPSLRVRPRWDAAYLRMAIPYGLRLEAAYLVTLAAGRIDLLLVYAIAGSAAAGSYSVALTVGSLVALVPFALSYASFPRLAYSSDAAAHQLAWQSWRIGLLASTAVGIPLAATAPVLIPFAFGSDFDPAVAPSLLLIVGAIVTGGQWSLARSLAARGRPAVMLRSFSASLVVMLSLDLVLIDELELVGAGIASLIGAVVGLVICLRGARRWGATARDLLPDRSDLKALVAGLRTVATDARLAFDKRRAG